MEVWYDMRSACERVSVSLRTLYRLIDSGALPAYKMGRSIQIREQDISDFLGRQDGGTDGADTPVKAPEPPTRPGSAKQPLPIQTGVRPSVNLARRGPLGAVEMDVLLRNGWSVREIALAVGARPETADRWPTAGVSNRWLSAVRALASTQMPGSVSTIGQSHGQVARADAVRRQKDALSRIADEVASAQRALELAICERATVISASRELGLTWREIANATGLPNESRAFRSARRF